MNRSKNLVTLEGYDEITRVFSILKKEKEYWVREKQIAAQLGDRSENAEYISAKENIRNLDKRLFRINNILGIVNMVDISKRKSSDMVLFGNVVKLLKISENEESELVVRLIGTHELLYLQKNVTEVCISNISPLGRKLVGKSVGEVVFVNNIDYEIIEIIR